MFRRLVECAPDPKDIPVVETDDGWFEASTVMAATDDFLWLISAVAMLIPFDDEGVARHEYQFGVAVTDVEGEDVKVHMHPEGAKPFVDDDLRPWVMRCVCAATEALVEKVQPRSIYRVTKVPRPPLDVEDKVLEKHKAVTKTLEKLGYRLIQTGTAPCGGVFWSFE